MINRIFPSVNGYNFSPKSNSDIQNLKLKSINKDLVCFKSVWDTEEPQMKDLTAKIISCFNPPKDILKSQYEPVTIDLNEINLIINQLTSNKTKSLLSNLKDRILEDPSKYDKDEKLVWADTFLEVSKYKAKSKDDLLKKMHILTFSKDLYVSVLKEIGKEIDKDLLSTAYMNVERLEAINETAPTNEKNIKSINIALTDMIADYADIVKNYYCR